MPVILPFASLTTLSSYNKTIFDNPKLKHRKPSQSKVFKNKVKFCSNVKSKIKLSGKVNKNICLNKSRTSSESGFSINPRVSCMKISRAAQKRAYLRLKLLQKKRQHGIPVIHIPDNMEGLDQTFDYLREPSSVEIMNASHSATRRIGEAKQKLGKTPDETNQVLKDKPEKKKHSDDRLSLHKETQSEIDYNLFNYWQLYLTRINKHFEKQMKKFKTYTEEMKRTITEKDSEIKELVSRIDELEKERLKLHESESTMRLSTMKMRMKMQDLEIRSSTAARLYHDLGIAFKKDKLEKYKLESECQSLRNEIKSILNDKVNQLKMGIMKRNKIKQCPETLLLSKGGSSLITLEKTPRTPARCFRYAGKKKKTSKLLKTNCLKKTISCKITQPEEKPKKNIRKFIKKNTRKSLKPSVNVNIKSQKFNLWKYCVINRNPRKFLKNKTKMMSVVFMIKIENIKSTYNQYINQSEKKDSVQRSTTELFLIYGY